MGGKLVHTRVVLLSDKPPWSSQKIEWKWAGNYVSLGSKQRLRERTVRQAEPPCSKQVPSHSICIPPFWDQRRLQSILTSFTVSEEKTFPILENPFKTSGASRKVSNRLKILLTSIRVDRFSSNENIIPWFQTVSFPPLRPPKYAPNVDDSFQSQGESSLMWLVNFLNYALHAWIKESYKEGRGRGN